jgi:hypothetical protein
VDERETEGEAEILEGKVPERKGPESDAGATWVRVAQIDSVLGDLVKAGTLQPAQATAVRDGMHEAAWRQVRAFSDDPQRPRQVQFRELAGYLGAALVGGAILLSAETVWTELGHGVRVGLLVSATLALILAGVALGGWTLPRMRVLSHTMPSTRRRLVGVLFVIASIAGAATVLEMTWDADQVEPAWVPAAGLLVAALGYAAVATLVGQIACWAWALWLVSTILGSGDYDATFDGLKILGVGLVWLVLAWRGVWQERYAAVGLASGTALYGAQQIVMTGSASLGYAVTALVGLGCFALFAATRNWLALATGVVAITLVVPEALLDWTDGSLGAAGALLAAGLALLGASAAGYRLPDRPSAHDLAGVDQQ